MSLTVISHSFQPRRGFHSTLSTIVALEERPESESDCSFFALYTFPQSVIIDRHELTDRLLSFEFWGESNLELPVFALNQSASSLLLVDATPTGARSKQATVDIPVHARYGEPGTDPLSITISSPTCFWACPLSASVPSAFSSKSPVADSTLLSSLAHFSVPSASSHLASFQVPVASKRDLFTVEAGTTTVILIAFLWLVYRSWRVAKVLQSCHVKEE